MATSNPPFAWTTIHNPFGICISLGWNIPRRLDSEACAESPVKQTEAFHWMGAIRHECISTKGKWNCWHFRSNAVPVQMKCGTFENDRKAENSQRCATLIANTQHHNQTTKKTFSYFTRRTHWWRFHSHHTVAHKRISDVWMCEGENLTACYRIRIVAMPLHRKHNRFVASLSLLLLLSLSPTDHI